MLAIFVLSTAINYLDRATLATVAPAVEERVPSLATREYGWIVNAFMLTYTLSAPFAGMLVDRIGLNRAATPGRRTLVVRGNRDGLQPRTRRARAAAAPCWASPRPAGFPPRARRSTDISHPPSAALGNAMNQAAVSLGLVLAPPIATWIAVRSGWRARVHRHRSPRPGLDPAVDLGVARAPAAAPDRNAAATPRRIAPRSSPLDFRRSRMR